MAAKERETAGSRSRKRQHYIDYDYQEQFSQNAEDLDEYFVEQMLRTGKANGIYATKEQFAGDQLEIEYYPEFTRTQAKEEGVQPINKAKQQKAQKELNGKMARKRFWLLCEHNFHEGDLWITLTYADDPASIDVAIANMQKFLRNINAKRNRRGLPNAKYVYVTEEVSEDEKIVRIHHHLLMDALLDVDTVMATWKHGGRNEYRRIEKDENGITGAIRYMAKPAADTKRRKYKKRWNSSTNLTQPPEKKHHQTRAKEINKMVANRDYIREYVETVKTRRGKRRYEGYVYTGSDVYYNNFNGRYYVRVRMRKEQRDGKEKAEKTRGQTVYSGNTGSVFTEL